MRRKVPVRTGGKWPVIASTEICRRFSTSIFHHLAGESGTDTTTDEGLLSVARSARRAMALRPSVYRATDIDHFDDQGISFPSRYALRFGSAQRSHEEARLPEVRAAFNFALLAVRSCNHVHRAGRNLIFTGGATQWFIGTSRVIRWTSSSERVGWDRYKGHAIRKNVAAAHRSAALAPRSGGSVGRRF